MGISPNLMYEKAGIYGFFILVSKNKQNLVPCFDKNGMGLFVYLFCCEALMEVIVIYEVYIDVYFVENVLLDMLVLLSVAFLFGKKPALLRLFLASVLGGAGAVLILWMGFGYGFAYILSVLVLDMAMCLILFSNVRQILVQVIYFHGICFAYTKIGSCMAALGVTRFERFAASALLASSVLLICGYKKSLEKKRLYNVRIVENGKELDFKALFDTGNSLTDPYTGKPVSIVEENADILSWLHDRPHKYRVIPFRSIGRESGLLEGTEVDELIICRENGLKVEKEAIIALYRGRLSGDGSYQVILNQGLL